MSVPSMKEPMKIPIKLPIDFRRATTSKLPPPSAGEYSSIDLKDYISTKFRDVAKNRNFNNCTMPHCKFDFWY